MTNAVRLFSGVALAMLVFGCSPPVAPSPSRTVQVGGAVGSLQATPSPSSLPAWITQPTTLPDGRVGRNNCSFPFGQDVPQWDFHADAGCWEHDGPDGWTRNQQQRIHIPNFRACGGGPGDANVIRVCRAGGPGQPNPCPIDPITGPNGCARCVINPTCH